MSAVSRTCGRGSSCVHENPDDDVWGTIECYAVRVRLRLRIEPPPLLAILSFGAPSFFDIERVLLPRLAGAFVMISSSTGPRRVERELIDRRAGTR